MPARTLTNALNGSFAEAGENKVVLIENTDPLKREEKNRVHLYCLAGSISIVIKAIIGSK